MKTEQIAVAGPGRMGVGIVTAILAAGTGRRVLLVDTKKRPRGREKEALERARKEIHAHLDQLRELGALDGSPEELRKPLKLAAGLGPEIADSQIVFECLPELPELKQRFLAGLEPLLTDRAIVASATSTINLKVFGKKALRPERLLTTHWLNPAFIVPLVEVSVGEKTASWATERMKAFLTGVGKIPVTLRDSPGFIVPRIQAAAMNEAVSMIEEGVASAEEIDTAIKAGFGFRLAVLGLVEFIDLGGADILYHAGQFLHSALNQPQFKPPRLLVEKMERGEVGPRAGKGFFDYDGVDLERLFKNRYQGFLELLRCIENSSVLRFEGGMEADRATDGSGK
ncbi:MAG: 3-hydroxyacyl-CoA dehydrogenase NAD-binding domain-containing protein [bacterium]